MSAMNDQRRGMLAKAATAIISLLLSLLACEFIIRSFKMDDLLVNTTANQYKFYRYDAMLGWVNAPNRHGLFKRGEFQFNVTINSRGMRYREVSYIPRPDTVRIAVMGDSFVWGIGVADEARFTERSEQLTNGKYEFLNFGVSGYSPVQYLLQLDEVLRFHPRMVVLTFCLGNDFIDNVLWRRYGYYKPYVTDPYAEKLKMEGYPLPHVGEFVEVSKSCIARWMASKSKLYALTAARIEVLIHQFKSGDIQKGLVELDEYQRDFYMTNEVNGTQPAKLQAIAVNKTLILAIQQKLKNAGVSFVVLLAPTKCEYGGCFNGNTTPNFRARDAIVSSLRGSDVAILDPTGLLSMEDFWVADGHWRPSGHIKIANTLVQYLLGKSGDTYFSHSL